MEKGDSSLRRWEDLDIDIMVKILKSFDVFELTSGPAQVCSAWKLACSDQFLWKKLDLSALTSNFIKIPMEPCPRLKRLVMPAWNRISEADICRAVHMLKDLESLTMPSVEDPRYVMEEITTSCKKFSELKIMGPCGMLFASSLVECLPNLKVLSMRCTKLSKDVLLIILEGLTNLEVLNISHCVITKSPLPPELEEIGPERRILTELDESLIEKASRLRKFLTCMSDSCIMCEITRYGEGLPELHEYAEDVWKMDEVTSLAI